MEKVCGTMLSSHIPTPQMANWGRIAQCIA